MHRLKQTHERARLRSLAVPLLSTSGSGSKMPWMDAGAVTQQRGGSAEAIAAATEQSEDEFLDESDNWCAVHG